MTDLAETCPGRTSDPEVRELEVRLAVLADQLLARARAAGPGSFELLNRGTVLQRAAFVLRAAQADEAIDLRDR